MTPGGCQPRVLGRALAYSIMLTFQLPTIAAVRFYDIVLAPLGYGQTSADPPLLDPDGHNVEAVYRSAETRARWGWLGAGLVRSSGV
jgi:hypothetical protein